MIGVPVADTVNAADVRHRDIEGARVRYLVADPDDATDPPIVLLHGGGLDAAELSWKKAFPVLSRERRVYAFDWPGYGGSGPPSREPSIPHYVGVLERALDALDVETASLAGVSMGGGAALGYTLSRPDRTAGLALIDSYGLGGAVPGGRIASLFVEFDGLNRAAWALVRRIRTLTALGVAAATHLANRSDELIADAREQVRRQDAGRAWRAFQRAEIEPDGLRTNYVDRLPDLDVPTLLIHGEDDPFVPVARTVRAGVLAPDATVRILPRCGHWAPRERPGRVNELLAAFL